MPSENLKLFRLSPISSPGLWAGGGLRGSKAIEGIVGVGDLLAAEDVEAFLNKVEA